MITKKETTQVAKAAVRSKAVVLFLFIYCLIYFPLCVEVLCWSLLWYSFLVPSFAIILTRTRELVALLLLSHSSLVTVNVLWL